MSDKPVILTFIGYYLPGYKAGGILRVIVNTVDHLCGEFDFRIVTRDRDVGDDKPYSGIKLNQWQQVGNARVYYLPPESSALKDIFNLIVRTPHDAVYLNSFFDPLTVKVLLNRKLHRAAFKPVIVAPWGEFAWASLKQKYPKKFVFIAAARLLGLYNKVTWRASSEFEKKDIMKVMKVKPEEIHITGDFPIKNFPDSPREAPFKPPVEGEGLRIVFLSRIVPEKNLDYALRVLTRVKARVVFDIYGPLENSAYWEKCRELIGRLPDNIKVNYLGIANADEVIRVFSRYDLFLFPTGGEAYGHVIAEALVAGTPVLLSTETPWRDLQSGGLGWDVDLTQMDQFVAVIERSALLSADERLKMRAEVKTKIAARLSDPAIGESNRQLFKMQLLRA